jgi:hypothetical protein
MDHAQRAGVVTAVFLLVMATIPVLYFRCIAPGRRQWKALGSGRRLLLIVCLCGWVSWVASTKVVRPWAAAFGLDGNRALGVVPSLIAGITVTAYAAFVLSFVRQRVTLRASIYGAVTMLLLEVVQLWMPGYVFDPFDVLAGMCGVALISAILYRLSFRALVEGSV